MNHFGVDAISMIDKVWYAAALYNERKGLIPTMEKQALLRALVDTKRFKENAGGRYLDNVTKEKYMSKQ